MDTTTTTASSATSTTVTELTLPPEEGLAPGIYFPDNNPLPAGTYTTLTAGVPITFTIPDGWAVYNQDQLGPAWIPNDPPPLSFLAITHFYGEVFEDPCGKDAPVSIENSALSLAGWFQSHPQLQAGDIETVTVGGVEGHRVLVKPTVPAECTEPPWLFLLSLPVVGDYHLEADMTAEFTTVEVDGIVLLIATESLTEAWEETKAIGDEFFSTVRIGD
ncbi:MAG TPA: hypothetical protein VFY46_01315 [Acidimicrobiia bacterium]|nr:hypothetical protein [Acidimicrobiia bacterium]